MKISKIEFSKEELWQILCCIDGWIWDEPMPPELKTAYDKISETHMRMK